MAQVAKVTLTSSWQSIETLMGSSFDSTKTYQIQAQYPCRTILVEAASAPAATSTDGIILTGGRVVQYKKGNNTLYGRSNVSTSINITVLGE